MVKRIFFPGEKISVEEEYSAGVGTYNDDGVIRATNIGEAQFDDEYRKVNIDSKVVKKVRVGDIVYGKVTTVRDSSVTVELIKSENGQIIINNRSQLPVRNVAKKYVSKISEFYKTGDFVKAKVSNMDKYSTDLATNETGLGVVNAYCKKCKSNLDYSNGKLMCLACGNVETRKWFEEEDKEEPRENRPRRDFDNRDRRHNNDFRDNRGHRGHDNRQNNGNRGGFRGGRNNNKHSGGRNFRGGRR
jgi:exosome complex component CSL4